MWPPYAPPVINPLLYLWSELPVQHQVVFAGRLLVELYGSDRAHGPTGQTSHPPVGILGRHAARAS
eukprot:9707975-Karenia_brevis.AAC.1